MKFLLAILLSVGYLSSASAAARVRLECLPKSPCQFADSGLKYCVSKVSIYANSANDRNAEEIIQYRNKQVGVGIAFAPQKQIVFFKSLTNGLFFQSSDGEQSGMLKSAYGGKYFGSITVDQDFEFEVSCINKAIGLE